MYGLHLNDVRMARVMKLEPVVEAQQAKPVMRAATPELLQQALEDLRVKPYKQRIIKYDEVTGERVPNLDAFGKPVPPYEKHFKKGSPLEWCVPPDPEILAKLPDELHPIRPLGTLDEWLAQTRKNYEDQILSIPEVKAG